ncbi:MAG TPA: DNA polymerase III subunit delta [Candidatus Paceibacterota bacterium]
MIIFLYGADGYRLKQNLDKVVEGYTNKNSSGMGFLRMDASDGMAGCCEKIEDYIKTNSFFNEKRLVVLRSPFSVSKEMTNIIKKWSILEDKNVILVLCENQSEAALVKKDKIFFSLISSKPSLVKKSEVLSDRQLESWIIKEVALCSKSIEAAAVSKLIKLIGGNSWLLSCELAKLVCYSEVGKKNIISAEDVDSMVVVGEDIKIFNTVDAVAERNSMRAIKLLHDNFESGADPYYVFSMLLYQFRNLLRVKDLVKKAIPYSELTRRTGLNPYVVKKTFNQSAKYELGDITKFFIELADMERNVKSGISDMEDEIFRFALDLRA